MLSRRQALARLRRRHRCACADARRAGPARSAVAGACPSLSGRRLRWIVPNAAGGGYDTESRLLQPLLSRRLGAEIVIDNQAGAGGLVGARAIAGARPDGPTLGILGVPGPAGRLADGRDRRRPIPSTAFTVLGRIARSWHVWGTGASSPLPTIDAVVAASARRPLVCAINEVGQRQLRQHHRHGRAARHRRRVRRRLCGHAQRLPGRDARRRRSGLLQLRDHRATSSRPATCVRCCR